MRLLVLIFALWAATAAHAADSGPRGILSDLLENKSLTEVPDPESYADKAEARWFQDMEARLDEAKRQRAGDEAALQRLRQFEARLLDLKERSNRPRARRGPCIGDCWLPGEGPDVFRQRM